MEKEYLHTFLDRHSEALGQLRGHSDFPGSLRFTANELLRSENTLEREQLVLPLFRVCAHCYDVANETALKYGKKFSLFFFSARTDS